MNRVICRLGLALLLVSFAASNIVAQDVYVTQSNNKIIKVDFETGATETKVNDKGTSFRSVVVRNNSGPSGLRLIAANKTRGGDIRIYDEETGAGAKITRFRYAHSIALSAQGDLFAANRTYDQIDQVLYARKAPGCADVISGPFAPGCLPGGYETPVLIDADVELPGISEQTLADVRQARTSSPGLFSPGDVLVLVEEPAMVIAYSGDFASCDGACEPEVVVAPGLILHTPTGLAIAGASMLIATKEGVILEVTANGTVNVDELYSLPGSGARIAVGADDGTLVAFATNPNKGGRVLEIDAATGALVDSITQGIKVPRGVGAESSSAVAVSAGDAVQVLLPQLKTTFSQIRHPGLFDGECRYYPHPNPGCATTGTCDDLFLSDLDPTVPPALDVLIPSYVQPFGVGSPGGPEQYLVCTVRTNAEFFGAYGNVHDEINSIGYDPGCETFDEDTPHEVRMFYAPIPGQDPTIAEGNQFIGITSDCFNSHSGRGWKFSYIMPIARDLRPTDENVAFKQTALGDTFENAKDDILGACPVLTPGLGPVPQGAFTAAGLGSRDTSWSHVPDASGAFGSADFGGNGLLLGGGLVEFKVKLASFNHAFGTADASGLNKEVVIASTQGAGGTYLYEPTPDPYLFYFENIANAGGLNNQIAYSDGTATDSKLDMAVYRNLDDPRVFALFFDDGGAGPDRDYTDTILTARGMVEAQCSLELAIDDGDAAVFDGTGIDYEALIGSLGEILNVVDRQPEAFLDPTGRNSIGEFRARSESEIFQACKPIGGLLDICPVHPGDDHAHNEQ